MSEDWIKERLGQSGRIIDGWEAMDYPSGKLEDLLEIIRNEIGTLERIAADESEWPAIPANYLLVDTEATAAA